jgi:hypothetical protein
VVERIRADGPLESVADVEYEQRVKEIARMASPAIARELEDRALECDGTLAELSRPLLDAIKVDKEAAHDKVEQQSKLCRLAVAEKANPNSFFNWVVVKLDWLLAGGDVPSADLIDVGEVAPDYDAFDDDDVRMVQYTAKQAAQAELAVKAAAKQPTMTVTMLKEQLQTRGLSTVGLKHDLLDRLAEAETAQRPHAPQLPRPRLRQ